MDILEKLQALCHEKGIKLEYTTLNDTILGLYYKDKDTPPIITINKFIISDKMKHIEVLAEEIGHHYTTYGDYTTYHTNHRDKLNLNKCESQALKWACNYLIADEEIKYHLFQGKCNYEISKDLGLPYCFIERKIELLRLAS